MKILLNGKERELAEVSTIAELLEELGHRYKYSAVALNMEFVPKDEYGTTEIKENDEVEIVSPQSGG